MFRLDRMAGHTCKLIILLIPALATVALLGFCLLSDWWIKINPAKLDAFKKSQELDFSQYLKALESNSARVVSKKDEFKPDLTTTTSTTSTTTTTTQTEPSTTAEILEHDEEQDETSSHDSFDAEEDFKRFKKLKRQISNQTEDYADPELDEKPSAALKLDHVYITQLWPFVKYKTLYYECVTYEKLRLRISVEYLNSSNKEPISGSINYGNLIDKNGAEHESKCKAKLGQISCLLNKQCVYGTVCDGIVWSFVF